MKIFIELYHDDVKLMKAISKYIQQNGSTPKKDIAISEVSKGFNQAHWKKIFEKLKHCEVIEHSRNGHCRLTDKGEEALLSAEVAE